MFRLGFDLRAAEPGFKAHCGRGIGRYATQLFASMCAYLEQGDDLGFNLRALTSSELRPQGWQKSVIDKAPVGKNTLESQFYLRSRMKELNCDLIHFVAHGDAPAWSPVPYVVTVLDLIPLRFKELYRASKPNWRFKFARSLEHRAIRNAAGVLAISEATKRDVVELLGIDPEKVVVTPLAADRRFSPRALTEHDWYEQIQMERIRLGLPLDRAIVLYVGGVDPRKNVLFLLDAFAEVCSQWTEGLAPQLVIAGAYDGDDQLPKVKQRIKTLGIEEEVRVFGYVEDFDLPSLYRAANVMAFPSLYEGFGLPVLEALACGVPVLAGNNSSLPEVMGGSDELLADNDKAAWVSAIFSLLKDPARQRAVGKLGLARAANFSWERTAGETLAAYNHFITGQPLALDGHTASSAAYVQVAS